MNRLAYSPVSWFLRNEDSRPEGRHYHSDDSACNCGFPVRMDLTDEKDAFRIVAELPGMDKGDIKVVLHDDLLTISGERKSKAEKENTLWSERYFGEFSRSFKLNDTVEKSGVSADYKDGLLIVSLPKKEEKRPKEIEVAVK